MLEVRNVAIYGLERAQRAISNSYSVGPIDTTSGALPKAAIALGTNMECHQSHDSFLRGVIAQFDMKYSLSIGAELQRYHYIEIVMSQSTMHSIAKLVEEGSNYYSQYVTKATKAEVARLYKEYISARGTSGEYRAFMQLRHNIPSGLELWQTISTNYLQLKTICIQRKGHKQREDWNAFIKACIKMPDFTKLTGIDESYIVPIE